MYMLFLQGFGFIEMTTHAAAEHAISVANDQVVLGNTIQCSWGTKPVVNTTKAAAVSKLARTKGM
jgi:RNA recognition motif-containing protein